MSKQQDLFDRAMSHFEDLKVTLKKIEQIAAEVKLDDVRSTVWVLKALMYCVFIVFVAGFVMEVSKGVLPSAVIVADDTFGTLTNSIFDKLGL
jgi:flagellar biosynthesis protein FlhB